MPAMPLHIVIISWGNFDPAAERIAAAVASVADRLTVVHSPPPTAMPTSAQTHTGTWIATPESAFFGPKFAAALAATAPDEAMLLLHADTSFDDWPKVVARCRWAFATWPELGVWSPDFTHIPWHTDWVRMLDMPGEPGVVSVSQTDGINFALAPPVLDRLRRLDIARNNLGWGIDLAAAAFSLSTGRLLLRDLSLCIHHPVSRGYLSDTAHAQMREFLADLTLAERNQILLILELRERRKQSKRPLVKRLWKAVFNRDRRPALGLLQ